MTYEPTMKDAPDDEYPEDGYTSMLRRYPGLGMYHETQRVPGVTPFTLEYSATHGNCWAWSGWVTLEKVLEWARDHRCGVGRS